jgi:hypothetical protein
MNFVDGLLDGRLGDRLSRPRINSYTGNGIVYANHQGESAKAHLRPILRKIGHSDVPVHKFPIH